ncbi:MAG TPA: hypothetical protein VLS27_14880 [Gammaproteobacteria bacterium]|nr:hypothetical protein [Gammaproteobacteria bacterium]
MQRKALTLRLDFQTYQALEFIAGQTGESMNSIINKAVVSELARTSRRLEKDLDNTLERLRSLKPSLESDAEEFARLESSAEEDPAEGIIVDMTPEQVRAARRRSIRTETTPSRESKNAKS